MYHPLKNVWPLFSIGSKQNKHTNIIWNRVDCRRSEKKRSETHERLKRMLFNQTKQDRMQIVEGIHFFKATNNTKTNKSHSCCQLGVSRRTVVCTRLRWRRSTVCSSSSSLPPSFPSDLSWRRVLRTQKLRSCLLRTQSYQRFCLWRLE